MNDAHLYIDNVSFSYGNIRALDAVNAAAHAGRITAIIGPNASGKSTLLRCMLGALRPHTGRITLDSAVVHRLSPRQLAREVAYVAQRPQVSAAFTVRDVVELGRYAQPIAESRIDDALDAMDIVDLQHRPFAALSGGQQQRVAVARALAQLAPDGVLLLDEPTTALDLQHVQRSMSIFRERATRGATVVMALHDLTLAAAIADDVWLMNEGRMIAVGPTVEVLQPDQLQSVFQTSFTWLDRSDGSRVLLPETITGVASAAAIAPV